MNRLSVYIIRVLMSKMSDNDKLLAIINTFDDMGTPLAGNLLHYYHLSHESDIQSMDVTDKKVTLTFEKL